MKVSKSRYCNCMYFSSAALARKIEKLATVSWKKTHLAPGHAYLLMIVLAEPGIQPGELAKELQLKPSTITRFIQKLEEKKLLVRTVSGKITNVYPTPKAKEMQPLLKECISHFYQSYVDILGKEESSGLVTQMNNISDRL